MGKKMPIFYSTLMLTGVNLLLRFVSTSFQVYLSSRIGAAGIGLLQLILSVSGFALTAGIAGIRTATMYLTAEELGNHRSENVKCVVSGCIRYCLITGLCVSVLLYMLAPWIAQNWIGFPEALPAIRICAAFVPVYCLCSVMTGYFTAANRIGTLAAVEVAEQLLVMLLTTFMLSKIDPNDSARACSCVVLGSSLGYVLTLISLSFLYARHNIGRNHIRVRRRILSTAAPLAFADVMKSSISSAENLIVPRRLGLNKHTSDPLASFGMVTGMVFPVIMFPAAILFSLAELLIPELARCNAAGSYKRIQYLVNKNLRICLLYGLFCGGILFLVAESLCHRLYPGIPVTPYLKIFACIVPMLYCDCIVDGMTKGLGQQKYCVRYNIVSNSLDIILLFVLLPILGIRGYVISFFITHLLNFILSLRRLVRISGISLHLNESVLAIASCMIAVWGGSRFSGWIWEIFAFAGLYFSICYFFGVLGPADLFWLKGLVHPSKKVHP